MTNSNEIDITLILLPSRNQIHDYGYIYHQNCISLWYKRYQHSSKLLNHLSKQPRGCLLWINEPQMKEQLKPPVADGLTILLIYNNMCSLECLISQTSNLEPCSRSLIKLSAYGGYTDVLHDTWEVLPTTRTELEQYMGLFGWGHCLVIKKTRTCYEGVVWI